MIKRDIWQRGDTIVEVMIVLAVLGLAFSISYTTASRSLTATRTAQENARATELLQSQIEALRYLSADNSGDPKKNIYIPNDFCIDESNYTVETDLSKCTNDIYGILIRPTVSAGQITFNLTAGWEALRGEGVGGRNSVEMAYRIAK